MRAAGGKNFQCQALFSGKTTRKSLLDNVLQPKVTGIARRDGRTVDGHTNQGHECTVLPSLQDFADNFDPNEPGTHVPGYDLPSLWAMPVNLASDPPLFLWLCAVFGWVFVE